MAPIDAYNMHFTQRVQTNYAPLRNIMPDDVLFMIVGYLDENDLFIHEHDTMWIEPDEIVYMNYNQYAKLCNMGFEEALYGCTSLK